MLVYLNQAYNETLEQYQTSKKTFSTDALIESIIQGAGMRVRPVMMTVATVIIGLLPVLYGKGTGSEVMSRIAAPMVGGMVSATVLTLLVLPVVYFLWRKQQLS